MVEELELLFKRVLGSSRSCCSPSSCSAAGPGKVTGEGDRAPRRRADPVASAAEHPTRAVGGAERLHGGDPCEKGRTPRSTCCSTRTTCVPWSTRSSDWGVAGPGARQVAWPLVENAYERGLDPATVVAIVLVESSGRRTPRASWAPAASCRSCRCTWATGRLRPRHVRHRGQPLLRHQHPAWNLGRFGGDERRALLAYNGCVRGTNTPNCHTYPDKVRQLRERIHRDWEGRARPATIQHWVPGLPRPSGRDWPTARYLPVAAGPSVERATSPARPEPGGGVGPLLDVVHADPLIGGVGVLAGQPEAHEQHGRIQDLLELGDDGDGAALAGVDHRPPHAAPSARSAAAYSSLPSVARHGSPPCSARTWTVTPSGATLSMCAGPAPRSSSGPGSAPAGSSPWPWPGPGSTVFAPSPV
jgi:hypothetical protein